MPCLPSCTSLHLHHPHLPGAMLGPVHCFLNITLRKQNGANIFFAHHSLSSRLRAPEKLVPSAAGLLAVSGRERGGWSRGEQRGAHGCRQRTPCTEPTSALLKHRSLGSSGLSPAPCLLPALSTHGCACTAHHAASSLCQFPASQTVHHVAFSWKTWGVLTTSHRHGAGAKLAPAAKQTALGRAPALALPCHPPPVLGCSAQSGPWHLAVP